MKQNKYIKNRRVFLCVVCLFFVVCFFVVVVFVVVFFVVKLSHYATGH